MRCQPGLRNRKAVKGMASAIADGVVVAVHPHLLDVTVTVTVTVCHCLSLCHCLGMSGDVTRPPIPRVRGDSRGWLYIWVGVMMGVIHNIINLSLGVDGGGGELLGIPGSEWDVGCAGA